MLRIGSLFSGIGNFELGLERAGVGDVVWQAESDAWCRGVLEHHWPKATRFDDEPSRILAHPRDYGEGKAARLHALGNALMPQIGELIGTAIEEARREIF